ncbi:hypothetical protein EXIGLDRAFT_722921 [Exidia glandulosa HHB12029]|uniref:Uncharacterized protein n=1 Tax=Exidia glandulosa HHB12029 TaxID=1314781 RepID=A0A165F2D4_EXIGL|nr:hypothetical protein EXIGLDRAFT_722921 [Exidia glandulosa HHB12029]
MSFNTIANSESARFRYFQARQAQIAHWQATSVSAPTCNYAPVDVGVTQHYHHIETNAVPQRHIEAERMPSPCTPMASPAVDKDLPQEQELDEVLVVVAPSRRKHRHRRGERSGTFIIPPPHYDVPLSDIPRRRRP